MKRAALKKTANGFHGFYFKDTISSGIDGAKFDLKIQFCWYFVNNYLYHVRSSPASSTKAQLVKIPNVAQAIRPTSAKYGAVHAGRPQV